MRRRKDVRQAVEALALGAVLTVAGLALWRCDRAEEAPTAPAGGGSRLRLGVNPDSVLNQAPEELFADVFENGVRITGGGTPTLQSIDDPWIGLRALRNGASFVGVGETGKAGGTNVFRVNPRGARPMPQGTPRNEMWGFYDAQGGDGPCAPNLPTGATRREVHDENQNARSDGLEGTKPLEKHCVTRGTYSVELWDGEPFKSGSTPKKTRVVDLPRSAGRAANSEDIEELNWPSGAGSGTPDVFPHFDVGTTPGTVSGTFLIDNPSTSAANDTIGAANRTVFRFDSQHDITGWVGAPPRAGS